MKKILPIFIVLLFFQTIVIVNATTPLKSVNHLYNFDLMPVDDSEIEIKKAMLTFDLRKMSDSFSPEAELKAQYTIINKGETRSVKLALPFLADYDEASDFFLQNLNINNNYLEPMLYVGDWCEDYISHGENEVEIDFKNEFSEATNRNYSVPELSGWLYKFKIPPGNSEVYLKAEFEPGMKFVLENNQFSPFSNYLHTTFYPPFDKENSYIYVLGDPNNLHFTTEDDITIIKEEMNFIDFFEEYLEEPDHYLKDLIIKHNIKKFLASDESAINQWDIKYYGYKRLWFQVLEPELLGDNIENILKFSYKVTGFINERYSPSIYEFRYYLSSTRYWNDYSNLTVRVYPHDKIKYNINDFYDFTWKDEGHYETHVTSYPEEMLLLRFSEKAKPRESLNPFYVLFIILIIVLLIPFVIVIVVGVGLFIHERKKEKRYKSNLQ